LVKVHLQQLNTETRNILREALINCSSNIFNNSNMLRQAYIHAFPRTNFSAPATPGACPDSPETATSYSATATPWGMYRFP
jgi:hypothetical protein